MNVADSIVYVDKYQKDSYIGLTNHSISVFKFYESMLLGIKISVFVSLLIVTVLIIIGIYGAHFIATYAGSSRIVCSPLGK